MRSDDREDIEVDRRFTITVAAAFLVLASLSATPASAADMKIGYIDSARIFAEYKGTEDAQKAFDDEVEGWEKQAEAMKVEMDSLAGAYQAQSLMLSDARKAEKEQEILQKKTAYETFVQSIWGPQGKLAEKNSELVQPIIEKINVILEKIGREENFAMIFNTVGGVLVYADPGLDLTDRVIEELNKETGENK